MGIVFKETKEIIKLDAYDKKILTYLFFNSRMPRNKLAKLVNISPQRLAYKIERFKKDKLIELSPFLNFNLLNIPAYLIFTPQLDEDTINKLLNNDSIYFFFQNIGSIPGVINVITDDINSFIKENLSNYHVEVKPILRFIPDNFNPFKIKIPYPLLKKDKNIILDKKDYLILRELSKNAEISLLEIQKNTRIDPQTSKKRIKKMLESNIIQLFRYGINVHLMGLKTYFLRLKIKPSKKEFMLNHIRDDYYAGFVFETYDGYNMHYLTEHHNNLFNYVLKLQKLDPEIIIEVSQCTDIMKVELVPKSVLKIFEERIKLFDSKKNKSF